jgi:hypothetical protein
VEASPGHRPQASADAGAAVIRAIQGVTFDGLTIDAAISNTQHAVANQDLTLIQPIGVLHDVHVV